MIHVLELNVAIDKLADKEGLETRMNLLKDLISW